MPLSGVMAKSAHGYGGGVNYLCLPLDPEFPPSDNTSLWLTMLVFDLKHSHYANINIET